MDTITKIKNEIQYQIDNYNNPGSYNESEYYVKCAAKVDVLEDLLYFIKNAEKISDDE